jgi:phage replication-related protein YjqB (UPF0714/DUF867 family)
MHSRVTNRRTVLSLVALAAPSVPGLVPGVAPAADRYPSYTALYADPELDEGVDYALRHQHRTPATTTVLAPHGGGIEPGTSELCLAIAGFHPASLARTAPAYSYWMFEGLRPSNNDELHVTSTRCDDPVALSLCGGSRHALGLHGCAPSAVGLPEGTRAALVGGRDRTFRRYLLQELTGRGFQAIDAAGWEAVNGDEPENIANRTATGMGGQLEITTPLRAAMFGENTRPQRKNTTTALFWDFVAAARSAIARLEAAR